MGLEVEYYKKPKVIHIDGKLYTERQLIEIVKKYRNSKIIFVIEK